MADLRNDLRKELSELQKHLSAHQKQLAEVTRQRDAEREARKALQAALKTYNEIFFGDDQADAALALAAKLP